MEKINKTGNALFHCFITLGLGIVLAGILSSCSVIDWFAGRTSDQEVKDMDKDISASMTAKKTPYDEALSQFGKMLDAYNITEVRVQSKVISNQTAEKELPDDVSRMLISAVNKIGKRIVYIPYDPNYVLNEANTGGNIARALPQIVLAGGITEFDKDLIEKGRELKTEVSIQKGDFGSKYNHDGGAGYNAEEGVSRITLDLQLMNYKTQTYMSGIQSINSVNIRKTKLGWGIGYYFQGSGMSFQYSLQKKQGKYHALRLLVELSVLEVMGKYVDLPYWKCIPDMPPDKAMIAKNFDEFSTLDDGKQNIYLKEYLFFHGINGFKRLNPVLDASEMALMSEAMKKYNCANKADLFIKLWETVPIDEAVQRNRDFAREQARKAQELQSERKQKIAVYNQTVAQADALYSAGKLPESREAFQKANIIFPDQKDPVEMIARIDKEIAAPKSTPQASPAPALQATVPLVAAGDKKAAPAKTGKEAPLNPFKKVDW
ncbi:MAG: hypothetical protein A2017_15360 [Lentisphaerae bacterium GWF2_44_16]|nr:MAG: hypothetical protein A2017_15360 [Lentisphaerae bacterium GWF2_44_16]